MIHLIHSKPKPNSQVIITGEYSTSGYDMVCCVHCRHHWEVKRGSGKTRGFCYKCMGPTCGSKKCGVCVPYEKMIDEVSRIRRT